MEIFAAIADLAQEEFIGAFLVFIRVGAVIGLAPGYGEVFVPMRVRLAVAVVLTAMVAPAVDKTGLPTSFLALDFAWLAVTEAAVGLIIGLAMRLTIHALQLAGAIAGQATALAQIAPGLTPDPMPAMGNALMIAGVALAMALDIHVKIVASVIASYGTLGFGAALPGRDVADWGLSHAVAGYALGFTLAAPFLLAALIYNLALGAINRAMPQLMVAFIGAPAITGGTLFLFILAAPVMLAVWFDRLDAVLANPFAPAAER